MRTRNRNYLEELGGWEMPEVYSAINALQATPWQINGAVLNVVDELWSRGATTGGLPPREALPLPAKPADIADSEESRRAWKRRAAPVHEENARLRSRRITTAQKLWLSRKFEGYDRVYFPHNLDWRGRAYPLPTLVHPQADDLGKALLRFAEGRPLGTSGGYWLAVHIANLFGEDKVSLDDRVAWVEANSSRLIDSALRPVDGEMFWAEADKPFQALAACFEWAGFQMEGDGYVSHLPVAMDGSCNGLQNFAAMLRDHDGGAAVNLTPSEVPQDVYQQVADRVIEKVQADLDKSEDRDQPAWWWRGRIDRKVVKRPVMTRPYGSARFGMRDQILTDTLTPDPTFGEDKWAAASYLSKHVFDAIGEVAVAAKEAMEWLQAVARLAASNDLPVTWVTPIGFLVMQAYRQRKDRVVKSHFGGVRVRMRVAEDTEALDRRKQSQGISPNFVHSLDAAHMMATVNILTDAGITDLAMIHDSYGTHACDVETLHFALREAFITQYTPDVLARFRDEIVEQLPDELAESVPPLPAPGKLELEDVRQSDFFFS